MATHNAMLFSLKTAENSDRSPNIDEPCGHYPKISRLQKDGSCVRPYGKYAGWLTMQTSGARAGRGELVLTVQLGVFCRMKNHKTLTA